VAVAPDAVVRPTPSLTPIRDFPLESRAPLSRPDPTLQNTAEAEIKVVATPRPKAAKTKTAPAPKLTGNRARGTATWYCKTGVSACHRKHPGGMYAAAGPELRVGAWRGRSVRVCAGGDCIQVRLIDWCACGGARVIDLYSDAFRKLAPLNAGVVRVTVSW
jgi:rare lipoprotein A (peptidoglycan hydrolase)